MRGWGRQFACVFLASLVVSGVALATSDPTMTSTSWSAVETELGGNGCNNSASGCGVSTDYSLKPSTDDGGASAGEAAVGNSSSTDYQTNAGFNTTAQPGLAMTVNSSSMNLGVLSTATTSSTTATFTVSDYTSYGYIVQIYGNPPTYGGHTLTAMGNNTSPATAGTAEQFGINLRANNSPSVSGSADPLEVPDNEPFGSSKFSYGQAGNYAQGGTTYGTNRTYTVPNEYTYSSGDTIASSSQTTGPTLFTISFLANIKNNTPAGVYTGSLSLIATGTY